MTEMEPDVGINNDHRIEKGHFLFNDQQPIPRGIVINPEKEELDEEERIKEALERINKMKKAGIVLNNLKDT